MSKGLLDPKVDFVFKNIFGSPNHPEILISFLNATLKPKKKIVSVDIKKTESKRVTSSLSRTPGGFKNFQWQAYVKA